jgi:hypothetical protein
MHTSNFLLLLILAIVASAHEVPEKCSETAEAIFKKFYSLRQYGELFSLGLHHNVTFVSENANLVVKQHLEFFQLKKDSMVVIDGDYTNDTVTFSAEVMSYQTLIDVITQGTYMGKNVLFHMEGRTKRQLRFIMKMSYDEKQNRVSVKSIQVFKLNEWSMKSSCKLDGERCKTLNSIVTKSLPDIGPTITNALKSIISYVKLNDK